MMIEFTRYSQNLAASNLLNKHNLSQYSHHTDQELGVLATISEMEPIGFITQRSPWISFKYPNAEFQVMLPACHV